jgi:hypothetical protein
LSNASSTVTFGTNPFVYPNGYTTDRFGAANKAKVLLYNSNTFDYLTASIADLPTGASPRTLTMWVKFTGIIAQAPIFGYGSQVNNQAFGLTQGVGAVDPNQIENYRWGPGNSTIVTKPTVGNNWYCYALVYNGAVCKIYRDGELLATSTNTTLSTTGTALWIGRIIGDAAGRLDAHIDDFKIYNTALSEIEIGTNFVLESPVSGVPEVTNLFTTNVYPESATINYYVDANGGRAASTIRYGTSPTALTSTANGPSTISNTPALLNFEITGLSPNTLYYYNVDATNAVGTGTGTVKSFTTTPLGTLAPVPTYQYNFNGDLLPTIGTNPFVAGVTPTFVSDGTTSNSAIRLNNASISAQLDNLAQGKTSRSFAIRLKYNAASISNQFIFAYGKQAVTSGFRFAQISGSDAQISFFNPVANIRCIVPAQTWFDLVVTAQYEAASSSMRIVIFKDGTQIYSGLNGGDITTLGTQLWVGQELGLFGNKSINADIDHISIYNTALTQAQVSTLGTLSTTDLRSKNLEVSIYPNPVKDVLNIESNKDVQSVEIFNSLGQKVLQSKQKQINTSKLGAGVYMIHIKDSKNQMTSKKFIKN